MSSAYLSVKYLKKYPMLAASIIVSVVIASVFEGASLGMIIPFIQSMTGSGATILERIPAVSKLWIRFIPNDRSSLVSMIMIILFFVIVCKNVFVYFSNLLTAKLKLSMARDRNVELMDNVIEYDLKYFDNTKTGHIISSMTNETKRMGDFMSQSAHFLAILARIIAFTVLLFIISAPVSGALLVLIVIIMLPLEAIMKRIKSLGAVLSKEMSDVTQKMMEILNGMRLIKTSATEDLEKGAYRASAYKLFRSQFNLNKYIHLLIPLSEVCIFGLISVCFYVSLRVFKMDLYGAFPFIATYLLVLIRTLTQLNALNGVRSDAMSNLAAFSSYEEMMNREGKRTILSGSFIPGRFKDAIEFKGVGFSYNPSRTVLKDINLKMVRGTITALVGLSGAGKSTLANLIPRLYDISEGGILVDGVSLKEMSLPEWRRKIGVVSQDSFIFNADVRYNISYGQKIKNDEMIIKAAKAANAHEFIIAMPRGYDTVLGDRGVKLSGGQKQRIAIARAIINNPEILILDEATSSLDTESERLITEAIDKLTENRTVIAIAHRLSTILHADKIVVLSEGRVIAEGPHSELVKNCAIYKKLYEGQFSVSRQDENTIVSQKGF